VTVYKLVTCDTVDEDIYSLGERKRQLSDAVLTDRRAKSGPGSASKKIDTGDAEDDIGAIGHILQRALAKIVVKPLPVIDPS